MIAMLQSLFDVIMDAKFELGIFVFAILIHFLLFKQRLPEKATKGGKGVKAGAIETKGARSLGSRDWTAALLRELGPLVRAGAKSPALAEAIRSGLATHKVSLASAAPVLTGVLQGFRALDAQLLAAVRKFLTPQPGYAKLSEQLLYGYMTLRLRDEFHQLLTEVKATCKSSGDRLLPEIAVLALQSALADKNFEVALECLTDVAPSWESQLQLPTRDQKLIQQLTSYAADNGDLPKLLEAIQSCGLCKPPVLEPVFLEAALHKNSGVLDVVERFAEDRHFSLSPASRCAVLLGYVAKGSSNEDLLKCYEFNFKDVDVLTVHTRAGRAVAEAALRLDRNDLLARLLQECGDARRVGLLKSFGKEGRLKEAKQVLEVCPTKSIHLHNALLDATVACGDTKFLQTAIHEAESAGVADVVTYNTVIKGHLQQGNIESARQVVQAMRASGLKPTVVTFNELLDASSGVCWALIDEMKCCEIKPNKVTCSILLKSLTHTSPPKDVERTFVLLGEMDDEMDEVLLSSVCEACTRTNRSDILKHYLREQKGPKALQVQGAHTYGSVIRGYGFIRDLQGVWATWRGMKMRNILPTSITLGCMVEALVTNDDIEAAYDLLQELVADERTKGLVNSVIYGSLLKGFCRQKRFERVWNIYEEMSAQKMEFSIVTYNSLIDACARSGQMHRVQPLLEGMASHGLEPNVITYSTVIKGYCSANRLDEAFELMEHMQQNGHLRPDEVTYNTLLDGCARYGLFDRGLAVIKEMSDAGVTPSNFTLSVVVKLATRAKRPTQAFELCDSFCKDFGIRPNVHVYNNLIQAASWCSKGAVALGGGSHLGRDLQTALQTVERMFREKVRPDARTYTLLVKCCVVAEQPEQALQLLRSASSLKESHPRLRDFASTAPLRGSAAALPEEVLIEVLDFACSRGHSAAAAMLMQELSRLPGARVSNKLCQRYAAKAMRHQ